MGFGLPSSSPGNRTKIAEKCENIAEKKEFSRDHFPKFSAIFCLFPEGGPREAKTYIFPIFFRENFIFFPLIGLEARNIFCSRLGFSPVF